MSNYKARRRRVVLAASAAVLATGVAACGSSGSGGSSSSSGPSVLTLPGTAATTVQADFNPFEVATDVATPGTDLLYLPLETYNEANGSYTPFLATGYKYVNSKEIEFTLRPGVKWSNGTPVTAQDVVWTFDLIKKVPALDTTGVWDTLASVSASGNKVIFMLKVPDSQIVTDLAQLPIVPESVWSKVATPNTYTNSAPTVVDGPYTVGPVSTIKAVLNRNPDYFNAAADTQSPKTVDLLPAEPTDQIVDLKSGMFDWYLDNDSDRGGFKSDYIDQDSSTNHSFQVPATFESTLYLNLTKAPFNDAAFRQALNLAINRNELAQRANINGYEPAAPQTGLLPNYKSLLPAGIPNGGMVTQNLAKAKQILTSNGYKFEGGKLIGPNGQQVSITIQTILGFTDWAGLAEGLESQLDALGINTTVTEAQATTGITNVYSGEYDAAIFFADEGTTQFADLQASLDSQLGAPVGTPAGGDFERLSDPAVDNLVNEASAAQSVSKQNALMGQLAKYMYTQVPFLDLTYEWNNWTYSTKNFTGWPTATNIYAEPISEWAGLDVIPNLKKTNG